MKERKRKIELFIAPSSDTEDEYEGLSYQKCLKKARKLRDSSAEVFSFGTIEELNAFIKGYEKGVGYLGEGLWTINEKNSKI